MAVASDRSANHVGISCSSLLSPTYIICRLVRMAILTGGIWFVVSISILAAIIRDAEHLVLRWLGYFSFHFFSFRHVWKFYVSIGILQVGCVCNLFL